MSRKVALVLMLALALVLTSCSIRSITFGDIETGPTVEQGIAAPVPAGDGPAELSIAMAGGDLAIEVGTVDNLVEGTVWYNVDEIQPSVQITGEKVRVQQGDIDGKRIQIGNWKDVENRWELTLGTAPMTLTVNAGAARTEMRDLAKLRAEEIEFNGGAGNFLLQFTGKLIKDMDVKIGAGAAEVTILVPEGTDAELTFSGALTDIDTDGDWTKEGDTYVHEGTGPTISFTVRMGIGKLKLANR